jgi:hypothetical protein
MTSMRLEQIADVLKVHAVDESSDNFGDHLRYPSPRYFQIHFQYLHELIESLQAQVKETNQHIALQNEILQSFLPQPNPQGCMASNNANALNVTTKRRRTG